MASKNDLSGLKINPKNTLLNLQKSVWNVPAWVAGRKPKEATEKQSELVGLKFTLSEMQAIKERAGLVPVATFLRNELMTKTDLFNGEK